MTVSPVERVKRLLRGEYGSMRHRFMVLPKLWISYGLHRLGGGSWTGFYRKIVDQSANAHHHQISAADRA